MRSEDAPTRVTTCQEGDVCVLSVIGELTSSADVPLTDAYTTATAHGRRHIVLDCAQTTIINSTGMALLMRIVTDCRRRGQQIAFTGLTSHFETLLRMSGLTQFGALYPTPADAAAALNEQV